MYNRRKRIFSIGTKGITIYHAATLEVASAWPYHDVVSVLPLTKSSANNEFLVATRKPDRKTHETRFSSEYRTDLLTEVLRFSDQYDEASDSTEHCFQASKLTKNGKHKPAVLYVNKCGILCEFADGNGACAYDYKDIGQFVVLSDVPNGLAIAHGSISRLHTFCIDEREQFLRCAFLSAATHVCVALCTRRDGCSMQEVQAQRFGEFSNGELVSEVDYVVRRVGKRGQRQCTMCVTERCVVERDAEYNVTNVWRLSDVRRLVRDNSDPQKLLVEFANGETREFCSPERDSLLVTVLDGARRNGSHDTCVSMCEWRRNLRIGAWQSLAMEEVEAQCVRWLSPSQRVQSPEETMDRFNANVAYCGLQTCTLATFSAEGKLKTVCTALVSLMEDSMVTTVLSNSATTIVDHEVNNGPQKNSNNLKRKSATPLLNVHWLLTSHSTFS